ncbi:hypothetical protein LSH36_594g03053 [Paralvinella palmiformis]|uniref:CRAL-TRIO domain-containing protein n=1 Tax=Paralvinella palmiformis TaxID=53620 RepID=A0AAD9J577_9ANNE|nr:hypothetical protein LSH36_594g03053 [Paralvinella palmiformis]
MDNIGHLDHEKHNIEVTGQRSGAEIQVGNKQKTGRHFSDISNQNDEDAYEAAEVNEGSLSDGSCSVEDEDVIGGAEAKSPEFDMMDEPELEFDEVGVELSAQDAELEAEEGREHEYLHNLHAHSSQPHHSQELAREEKEHPFGSGAITPDGFIEEDFEEELGSPLQDDEDDDDPNIEFRDIAKFGIIEVAGDDIFGRKVIVFSACRLPPHRDLDHNRFLQYLRFTLDQYVENDYTLVYFHHGLNSRNKPSFAWLRQAYKEFDRKKCSISNDLDGAEDDVLWAEQYDKSDTDSDEESNDMYNDTRIDTTDVH